MGQSPRVTVGVPCFNSAQRITATVEAILATEEARRVAG